MTAIEMDGFNHYGTGLEGIGNMLDGVWAEVPSDPFAGPGVPPWGPRTGSYALLNTSDKPYRYVLASTKGRIFQSFGFSVDGLPRADFQNSIVAFCTSGNDIIANLWCQSDGRIVLTGANTGIVLASTQGPIIVSRAWHLLEMDFDAAGGKFVLRVDDASASETPAINATGLSYTSAVVGQLQFIKLIGADAARPWLADWFLRDALGTVNNSWLGDRRIATLLVNGDTPAAGWTARYYRQLGAGILNNTFVSTPPPGVLSPTSASLNIGAGDFTMEGFTRFKTLPAGTDKATIFSRWDEGANQRSYELFLGSTALNGGALCFQTSTDGSNSTVAQPVIYPWAPETDTWYHVAIVRASGELLLFVDGQQLGLPIADSNTYFAGAAPFGVAAEAHNIGILQTVVGTNLIGWMDEVRFTNGFARYTSNFTPPTAEFPRGVSDPQWADVVLLAGFDTLIQDESGFGRSLTGFGGSVQQTVNDGPAVGVWSTLGKQTPDDNTFAEAPFLPATSILTLSAQPADNDTVTVGTTDGTTPAVYTFQTALASAYDVLIDTTLQQTLQNFYNAVNAGPGGGTKYGTGTVSNFDVAASQLPAGQVSVSANTAGTAGNSIATSAALTNGGGWTGATLAGGTDIPGPSEFTVQRPPPLTTIISAVQVTQRTFKSDSGLCTVESSFIGPLGNATTGVSHSPTISPSYFRDMFELDPDTSGPISPTTVVNGRIRLNRAT